MLRWLFRKRTLPRNTIYLTITEPVTALAESLSTQVAIETGRHVVLISVAPPNTTVKEFQP